MACSCGLGSCAFQLLSPPQSRVIIVGSSPSVLDRHLGPAIDEFTNVVRINCAPTSDFREHVGTRTTFRVVNELSRWVCPLAAASMTIVAPPRASQPRASSSTLAKCAAELERRVRSPVCRPASAATAGSEVFVGHELSMRVRHELNVPHPTTGFIAIALFSHFFTRPITLHGFTFFLAAGGQRQAHYWAANSSAADANAFRFHNSSRERELIFDLAERGLVSFLDETDHPNFPMPRSAQSGQPLSIPVHDQTSATCLAACTRVGDTSVDAGHPTGAPECNTSLHEAARRLHHRRHPAITLIRCVDAGALCCTGRDEARVGSANDEAECAAMQPFRLVGGPLRSGDRVLLTQLRTKNMAILNGSIGVIVGEKHQPTGLMPVRVLFSHLPQANPSATWLLKPQNLITVTGATPEEIRRCGDAKALDAEVAAMKGR
jgi:hypothetical protein